MAETETTDEQDEAKAAAYAVFYLLRFRRDVEEKQAALDAARRRLAIAEKEFAEDRMITGNEDGIPTLLRGILK